MIDNYNVGIYIRLSKEDNDKKLESESIKNQRSLLVQYALDNNLKIYDFYIDDGYSGTNFNRPEFKRLIKDIEQRNVNMVITKDMSRLGRDYIKVGELLEKYFPEHGVRYIAVTDNVDTYLDTINNDITPFKAIMNDFYAKDISRKIKSSLKAKMKDGKFVGSKTPFGYNRDILDKNHLVINLEQAEIVKRIFEMAFSGLTCYKIAKKLTDSHIKTPAQYYDFVWKKNYNKNSAAWNVKTIKDILTNRVYIGDLVQNKRGKVNYKVKKIIKNSINDYIIVEKTHEPIIDIKLFYDVQKLLPKNVCRFDKKENNLLDGLLFCGDCGHRISVTSRRKNNKRYTICNYYRSYIDKRLCTVHSNNYDELESLILIHLDEQLKNRINRIKRINKSKLNIDENILDNYLNLKNNPRDLIVNLIDKIYIFQNKTIKIKFSFN